jgi:hypothetical protein
MGGNCRKSANLVRLSCKQGLGTETRLDKFTPIRRLVTLGCSLKISEVAQKFMLLFSMVKVTYFFCPKMGWATFWAIFHKFIWGRCYDHNFLRFLTIFGGKMAFFSKTNVMIKIFSLNFLAKIKKNHNIGPWSPYVRARKNCHFVNSPHSDFQNVEIWIAECVLTYIS